VTFPRFGTVEDYEAWVRETVPRDAVIRVVVMPANPRRGEVTVFVKWASWADHRRLLSEVRERLEQVKPIGTVVHVRTFA
jgi:hypothetical protein